MTDLADSSFSLFDGLLIAVGAFVAYLAYKFLTKKKIANPPPHVDHLIPVVGSLPAFSRNPSDFIYENQKKYGDVFSATLLGQHIVFLAHPRVHDVFFKAKDEELSQREVYKFATPVFGKGVVYDAPLDVFNEQLKFVSSGMNVSRYKTYVNTIREEAIAKFAAWGDEGTIDVYGQLAELTILTACSCLLGQEIRSNLKENRFAELYHDLDAGLDSLSFFIPWLPTPKHIRRDKARDEAHKLFSAIIKERRAHPEVEHEDVLQSILTSTYKNGEQLPESHICGILLAALFAGQHTSSITSTWTTINTLLYPEVKERVLSELKPLLENRQLDYDTIRQMNFLEACMKESLRMYPPLVMLARYVKKTFDINNYTVPEGSIMMVSPAASGRAGDFFENPSKFDPDRYLVRHEDEKLAFGYIAFGGGRHKCVGENFAYLQVKTIVSILFNTFELELVDKTAPELSFDSLVIGPKPPIMVKYKRIKKN